MPTTQTSPASTPTDDYPSAAGTRQVPPSTRNAVDRRVRDAELAARVAHGSADALRTVYEEHADAVLRSLYGSLHSYGLAADVLQDVFLQFWRRCDRYDPSCSTLRGWLLVIARSRALDVLRSHAARSARERRYAEAQDDGRGEDAFQLHGLERRLLKQRVRKALAKLPTEQRSCVELAYLGELSHAQVARHLGQPLGTVKSRILLGMKKLRCELVAC